MENKRKTFEEVFSELTSEHGNTSGETITINEAGETIITTQDGISVYADYAPAPATGPTSAAQTKPRMTIRTFGEILDTEYPVLKWAVQGIIPSGLTILAGGPKQGKSAIALNIAIAVASGDEALGRPTEQGAVLYLALEDSERRIKKRGQDITPEALRLTAKARQNLFITVTAPRQDEGGLQDIEAWIKAHSDARLVIIDTLQRFRRPQPTTGNLYDADYKTLVELQAFAMKHDIALLVLHHTTKRTDTDWLNEISGSQGIAAAVDAAIVLKRARGEKRAKLHITGRDIEVEEDLAIEYDGLKCRIIGDAREIEAATANQQILDCISNGINSPSEIAKETGQTANAVSIKLHKLLREGIVAKTGYGRYTIKNIT